MNTIKEKLLQKSNLWHVGAISLFLLISIIFYYPALQGKAVEQHDVKQWVGMSQEIKDYVEHEGQIGWTNAMFSGMPATQIRMSYPGRAVTIFLKDAYSLWLPRPISLMFIYLLSFYIMALSFKVKPYIAIIGALAFGLSAHNAVIIGAGHITKAMAIGFAPLLIAGFNYVYRWKNWILGAGLATLFMSFELQSNHVQITYYMAFILLALGIVEIIKTATSKEADWTKFGRSTAAILVAYSVAGLINYGNLTGTSEYAEYTTRGGTELTINPDGSSNAEDKTEGLDKSYITEYSMGKLESFSLLVPNFKGGESIQIGMNESNESYYKEVNSRYKDFVKGNSQYWGDQRFVSGPVYIGIVVVFLAFLALVYSSDKRKWAFLGAAILALMLSWGSNLMGFTEFFLDYLPGYNKFRAVTIVLAVVQLALPVLAVIFLTLIDKSKEKIVENMTPLYVVSGIFGFFLLVFLAMPTAFNSFYSVAELDMLETVTDSAYLEAFDELEATRISIFRADVLRSLAFLIGAFGIIFMFVKNVINNYLFSGLLVVLILLDLGLVSKRYLNNEKKGKNYVEWVDDWKQIYAYEAQAGETAIYNLEVESSPEVEAVIQSRVDSAKATFDKDMSSGEKNRIVEWVKYRTLNRNTHFRVREYGNPWNSTQCSYFFKSVGGYHGAKLGRYQDLISFHLGANNPSVADMLNVKYSYALETDQNGRPTGGTRFIGQNMTALGNAWLVKNVETVETADEEILALKSSYSANLTPGTVYPILLNGKQITTTEKVDAYDRVAFAYSFVQDTMTIQDTIDLRIPFESLSEQEISQVPDGQGGLTWYPSAMLDSMMSQMEIIKVSSAGRNGFDPKTTAVMHTDFASKLSQESYSGVGEVALESYHPDKMTYSYNATEPQLVVFSEVYYPIGWRASIEDDHAEILRVNYALRALEVPSGKHTITFAYKLPSFERSGTIAWAGTILLLAILAFGMFKLDLSDEVKNSPDEV